MSDVPCDGLFCLLSIVKTEWVRHVSDWLSPQKETLFFNGGLTTGRRMVKMRFIRRSERGLSSVFCVTVVGAGAVQTLEILFAGMEARLWVMERLWMEIEK
jgi:hypothetical protein